MAEHTRWENTPTASNRQGVSAVVIILTSLTIHLIFRGYHLIPFPGDNSILLFAVPSAEFLFLFGIMFLFPRNLLVKILFICVFAVCLTTGIGELFYRYFYLDHFQVQNDLKLLPSFVSMVLPALLPYPKFTGFLVSLIVAGILYFPGLLVYRLYLRRLVLPVLNHFHRPMVKMTAAGMIISGIVFTAVFNEASPLPAILKSVLHEDNPKNPPIPGTAVPAESVPAAAESNLTETSALSISTVPEAEILQRSLVNEDLHIFVIESYGSTLFAVDVYIEYMRPVYIEIETRLQSAGWTVYSSYVRSPVFGGRSWMADASLLSGKQIGTQGYFDTIAEAVEPAELLRYLENQGYYRIYAAPGTTVVEEPWLSAYPFEEYLLRYDFDYRGPFLNLGAMSDQFILYRVAQNHLLDDRKEFVLYLLVSSHVPFNVIPVYVPEWDRLGDGELYNDGYLQSFNNNWLSGGELAEGYLAGIEYSLTSISGYVTDILSDEGLIVLLGDHQPRKPISDSRAGYAVPIHILFPSDRTVELPPEWHFRTGILPEFPLEDENIYPEMGQIFSLITSLTDPR